MTGASSSEGQHPTTVGPYHIVDVIGEGGMGVVYAAEQVRPVRRRVALKMMKAGMDSREVVGRFQAERQALAVMEHPGIAKVLDAGVSESGRPYFVMELVKGVRIDDYCARFRLTLRERIELFISLCQAVQHAHQKGVIHRDLKPSNVLVTEQDGHAVPKIIDFGIAKATGARLTEDTFVTTLGQAIGTLAYMSPEQAEGSDLDVDTRADIYSLGIILYELLVGRVPIDPRETGVPSYLARLVSRDTTVPRPPERLSGLGEEGTRIAAAMGMELRGLRRALGGDVQWIIMKAIEKDRSRRYETANGLSLELRRYLDDEPILARPPSTTYRLNKFVRRNRAAVVAGGLAVVALMAGTVATSLGLVRARRAEAQARASEMQAAQEAETARQVSDFLVDLFQVSDPGEARGSSITAREILDRGSRRVQVQLAEQPLVQARLLATIGEVYRRLGLYDDAVALLSRSLTIREQELPADHMDVAEGLYELGIAQRTRGDLEAAEENLVRALAIREGELEPDDDRVGHALLALGGNHLLRGRLDEAERALQRALSIEEGSTEPEHPEVGAVLSDLGALALYRGEYGRAEQYFLRATNLRERLFGPDHPDVGNSLNNLGAAYYFQERYEEALDAYERALALWEPVLGPDHFRVAQARNNIAEAYWALGRYAEAEPVFLEALRSKQRTLTPDNPSIASTLVGLANLYRDQSRFGDAEPRYRQAMEILEAAYGPDHVRLGDPLRQYATMLREAGREAEAQRVEARAEGLGGGGG